MYRDTFEFIVKCLFAIILIVVIALLLFKTTFVDNPKPTTYVTGVTGHPTEAISFTDAPFDPGSYTSL